MMRVGRLLLGLLLLCTGAMLHGEERFPPPDFTTGYAIPATQVAAPRADWLVGLDAALLIIALAVAGWLVHGRRSRTGIVILGLCSLAWFGFVREGCVCPIGAIQNVAEAAATGSPLPWIVALFFLLPLATALIAGRLFCSGVCPLGAIQDLVLVKAHEVPAPLAGALSLLPYAYLAAGVLLAALGGTWIICKYDPFVGFFRQGGPAGVMLFGGALLAVATVVGRPYCRFLCPYGVLLRWLSPLAKWRVRVAPVACIQCRLCEKSCPFGAIHAPTPPAPAQRRPGTALVALATVPLLMVLAGILGWYAGPAAARWNHQVVMAESIAQDAAGKPPVEGSDEAKNLDTFRRRGGDDAVLQARAATLRGRFRIGAALAGAFLGLVLGVKLVRLSMRRRSRDYLADDGHCLACARCLDACPPPEPVPAPVTP